MYQTATQVNVLSPEIFNIIDVDGFHLSEDSMIYFEKARNRSIYRDLRQWYDTEWMLQELGRSKWSHSKMIASNKLKKQGTSERHLEVGLFHSKGVAGVMPCETRSHLKGTALPCRGTGKHQTANEQEQTCSQN
jgi:hypothetical protein